MGKKSRCKSKSESKPSQSHSQPPQTQTQRSFDSSSSSDFTVDATSHDSSFCKCTWLVPIPTTAKAPNIASRYFPLLNSRFRLRICPNVTPMFFSLNLDMEKPCNPMLDCFASFKFTIVYPSDQSMSLKQDLHCRFSAERDSFAWPVLSLVLNPRNGFLLNPKQSLLVTADVRVLDEIFTLLEDNNNNSSSSSSAQDLRSGVHYGKLSWTIRNFSLFKETIKTTKIFSPSFKIGVLHYQLSVRESTIDEVEYLSLFLQSDLAKNVKKNEDSNTLAVLPESDIERQVSFNCCWGAFVISIMNQKPGLHHVHRKSLGRVEVWGDDDAKLSFPEYMKMEDFTRSENGFLADDNTVTFGLTFHVVEESYFNEDIPGSGPPFGQRHADAFGKFDIDCGMFYWEIRNFKWLKNFMKKNKMAGFGIESDMIPMARQHFRLVVYPRGKKMRPRSDAAIATSGQSHEPSHLSLFLKVINSQHTSDWDVLIHFRLAIRNCGDSNKSMWMESVRRCHEDTEDLGCSEFIKLDSFFDRNSGYMTDGTAMFSAEVHVLKETFTEEDLIESGEEETSRIELVGKRKSITWKVENFLWCMEIVAARAVFSRFFKFAGCEFRIGVFVSMDFACVYLDCDHSLATNPNTNFWITFRIGLMNQEDPTKSLWKRCSLSNKTCSDYYFRLMKLSHILEPDAGYIAHNMLIFVCEILNYYPWFDFPETEVMACEEDTITLVSDLDEPLSFKSELVELIVERKVNGDESKMASLSNFAKSLNSKDTEITVERKVDADDGVVASSSNFSESLNDKDTEITVKRNVDVFSFKHLISKLVCLLMNENRIQPLDILKEELRLDIFTLAAVLLNLHFHIDNLDKINLLLHPSKFSAVGELKNISDESLPSSESLMTAIKVLQQKIDGTLLDIMLECYQPITSVVTCGAVSQSEMHGELGLDKDLQCFDLNFDTTIQTIIGQLISELGTYANCTLAVRSSSDSKAMKEPLEGLLGLIINLLKSLSASVSLVCVGPHQGPLLADKISFVLDKAPIGMQPYLVALLCKLVNPLHHPLASIKLLNRLEKLDAELALQPPRISATSNSHFVMKEFWVHVFYQNLAHLEVSNDEALCIIIRLLFRVASQCQLIPEAVKAVRGRLKELGTSVPTCVLSLLSETINSWDEIAEAMLRDINSAFELDDLTAKRFPLVDKQHFAECQFSDIYILLDLLLLPSMTNEATKAFEKGIAHGFIVEHLVAEVLERNFHKKLKVEAAYSGEKYQLKCARKVREEICYPEDAEFTVLLGLAETLSISNNPHVCEFVKMFYATLIKLFAEENHHKIFVKRLFDDANNCQNNLNVLLFLVHEGYDVAKQVLSMMREAIVLASADRAALRHRLSAIKDENNRKTEELLAEISSLNKEKAILLERLSVSEATIHQCKSEMRHELDRLRHQLSATEDGHNRKTEELQAEISSLNKEKATLSEWFMASEATIRQCKSEMRRVVDQNLQLALVCSERDDKIEELKRQDGDLMKLVEEKNILAERLKDGQHEIETLNDKLRQRATDAAYQAKFCLYRLDKMEKEAEQYKARIHYLEGKLMAYQQQIRSP